MGHLSFNAFIASFLSLITSTGLNLINCNKHPLFSIIRIAAMCTYPVQPVCTLLLHIPMFILIFIKSTVDCNAHFISLHTLLLILFYFLLIFYLILTYIYIYSPVLCFIFYFIFLHCPLSGPVLTYISLLIIPCMIVYVTNNKEPWTLNLLQHQHGVEFNQGVKLLK